MNFLPNTAPYISSWLHLISKSNFPNLMNFLKKTTEQHNHLTRSVFVEEANSKSYGIDSVRYQTATIWNKLQKKNIIEHFLKSYILKKNPWSYQGIIQTTFEISNRFWAHQNWHPNFDELAIIVIIVIIMIIIIISLKNLKQCQYNSYFKANILFSYLFKTTHEICLFPYFWSFLNALQDIFPFCSCSLVFEIMLNIEET